ncbi:potassium-transporting ATPase subunit KdpA [Streptomyces litchfieldiae]|uniref:Potassium-transporting ATPase potassium-binding subunit n=1 Tax=Streptomyces litchfieldiae TaxID=3075543 RepID=A0ABU2MZ08_9ACTN|nr:potassium-transporting ATPase subunit KdpA [Streptomyces sp. DSM 44938]MDT0346602.1 potassium-transporting ATPase subunit KdpA [Streptomyces sp. DSM 44938]
MNRHVADVLQVSALIVALVLVHRPLGDYMAAVYSSKKHLRAERWIYRAIGADPDAEMRWPAYLRAVLAFSVVGVLFLYAFQRVQNHLPLSLGFDPIPPDQAFNTAVSFVSNTNWQSYSGEAAMGHLVQAGGLAVQNFLSAAVGMAVAIALVRGFTRFRTGELGNFWADLVRGTVRILLPIAVLAAIALVALGAIQNFSGTQEIQTLTGAGQHITGGPVASQEAIKNLGTNGGGFYNANSSHPFENPDGISNLLEIFLLLVIPFSLPRTFGKLVGSVKQGYAIVAAMGVIWLAGVIAVTVVEHQAPGTASQLAGGSMEGKEQRFGEGGSSLFAVSTTMTSTGSVNSFHDSFQGLSGGVLIFGMVLGEVAPGGVGSGLYGMLIMAVIAVFISGLMVGRTPEYLGKKLGPREIKLAACAILITPALVLAGTALAMALPDGEEAMTNVGPHGFSEVLYAYASASNNNGSAFAGFGANTEFFNTTLGICMLLGRFLPMVFVLALAGSLAEQQRVPVTAGTLRTHKPLFAGMLVASTVVVAGLTFFPALSLGPLAEGLAA